MGTWLEDEINTVIDRSQTVANNAVSAGVVSAYTFAIPDAAGDVDYDIVVADKFEVIDVVVRKSGAGAGNTVQLKNGATAITDAIAAIADKAITRPATIDPAQSTVLASGTLRCTAHRAAGTMLALVTVFGFVRA